MNLSVHSDSSMIVLAPYTLHQDLVVKSTEYLYFIRELSELDFPIPGNAECLHSIASVGVGIQFIAVSCSQCNLLESVLLFALQE